ncbi:MAG: M81 family metallopeptidase [Chloroflexi bacterium]|nr:M81 family metallopeptidase [Chloroflexota bacterium]
MNRIALGGIVHETNTFAPGVTTLDNFMRQSYAEGEGIAARYAASKTALGGAIDGLRAWGVQIVPLVYAAAMPSATVTRAAHEMLRDALIERLRATLPLDGVLLVLHGAMVADGYLDSEADILEHVRAVVGPGIPVVSVLDMHGNLSQAMVDAADAFVAFDENPHLDTYDRGIEASRILRRLTEEGARTAKALARPPLILSALTTWTDQSPLNAVHALGREFEQNPHVLNVSVMGGFAYADTPFTGMSVVVTTDGDATLARKLADQLCEVAWSQRAAARHVGTPVDEAVARAVALTRGAKRSGPVMLADVGDNVGGGSPGDSTYLLRALVDAGAQGAVVTIADPESVAQAIAAGLGAELDLRIGGKVDSLHGTPVAARATVENITEGRFTIEGTDHFAQLYGNNVEMGRCAVVRAGGVRVLLTERKTPPGDLAQLRSQGIVPEDQQIIVAKSAVAFRGAYQRIASEIIEVDTPGLVAANLARFTYKHLPRPVYPLDSQPGW